MAAGEYVSVSSQVDVQRADLQKEKRELVADPDAEFAELATIYRERGLPEDLANQVAQALHDADPYKLMCVMNSDTPRSPPLAPCRPLRRRRQAFSLVDLCRFSDCSHRVRRRDCG